MYLIIDNKSKLEVFVSIFQLLKNWCSYINIHFEKEKLYIQTMDKSHICLANIEITDKWFTEYECLNNNNVSVDLNHFVILINYALKHDKLELKFDDNNDVDKIYINFLNCKENKSSFDNFFELIVLDIEEDSLVIPNLEYDVEFTIESKKFVEILSELNTISPDLNIKCSDTKLELNATGEVAILKVNIPLDELYEFSITEGNNINTSVSLIHLNKMCLSTKINSFINVAISNELPILLNYNLGENSNVTFYIAPKIIDNYLF